MQIKPHTIQAYCSFHQGWNNANAPDWMVSFYLPRVVFD
jgi:hypothetical protein